MKARAEGEELKRFGEAGSAGPEACAFWVGMRWGAVRAAGW